MIKTKLLVNQKNWKFKNPTQLTADKGQIQCPNSFRFYTPFPIVLKFQKNKPLGHGSDSSSPKGMPFKCFLVPLFVPLLEPKILNHESFIRKLDFK